MIKFRCPSCQIKLGVPDEYGGKRIRCSKCNQPSIVPKQVEEISLTPQPTRTGDVVLEPFQKYESSLSSDLPPMDPNAEVLRQISHDRLNKTSGSGAPSENTGRFAFLFGLFKWFQGRFGFGNFYLAVISALVFMVIVISVWLALSKLTGLGLEFMFIPTALAPGLGFCVFSRSRGPAIGFLSLFLGFLAIILARIAHVHCYILPEWKKLVTSVEITPEYEKIYSIMSSMPFSKKSAYDEIAKQNSEMIAVAISSLIVDKQIEPLEGVEIYLKVKIPAEQQDDPNQLSILFEDSPMSKNWELVRKRLSQWDLKKRSEAAQKYFYRCMFFQTQCRQKAMLDNYPLAMGAGFFYCSNCLFFMLRIVFCVIGLIGAYKTCSTDYFE